MADSEPLSRAAVVRGLDVHVHTSGGPNELILLVEDNDKDRKLMRDGLQFHGLTWRRQKPAKTASGWTSTGSDAVGPRGNPA